MVRARGAALVEAVGAKGGGVGAAVGDGAAGGSEVAVAEGVWVGVEVFVGTGVWVGVDVFIGVGVLLVIGVSVGGGMLFPTVATGETVAAVGSPGCAGRLGTGEPMSADSLTSVGVPKDRTEIVGWRSGLTG